MHETAVNLHQRSSPDKISCGRNVFSQALAKPHKVAYIKSIHQSNSRKLIRIFLNSINKIAHQMCTFKAGMLEHSVMGPQIPLGKRMYVCVLLHDVVMCKYGLHSDESWHITKSEVLRVASLKRQVFWDVTHQLIKLHTYQRVAGPSFSGSSSRCRVDSFALNLKAL